MAALVCPAFTHSLGLYQVLDVFDVGAKVYRSQHTPRVLITSDVSVRPPPRVKSRRNEAYGHTLWRPHRPAEHFDR